MASYTRDQIIGLTQGKDGSRYQRVNLTSKDFTSLDLSNINFLSTNFSDSSDFTNANLKNVSIRNASFKGVATDPANLSYTKIINANFSNVNAYTSRLFQVQNNLSVVNIAQSIVKNGDFNNCNFRYANFEDSFIENCDFSFSNFSFASFKNLNSLTSRNTAVKNCNFDNCIFFQPKFISDVEFIECSFKNAKFIYLATAQFQNLKFNKCNMQESCILPLLAQADLTGTMTFVDCNLSSAFIPDQSELFTLNAVRYQGTCAQPADGSNKDVFRYVAYFD